MDKQEEIYFNVKCVKSKKSSQVILNKVYKCVQIFNSTNRYSNNNKPINPIWKVSIQGLSGNYPIENFTNEDGSKIRERSTKYRYFVDQDNHIDRETMSKGNIIVCNVKHLKTLTFGKYYHIDKILGTGYNKKITIKELNNNRYYSPYNFRTIPVEKLRELEIDGLLGKSKEMEEKTTNYNEINHLNNLEKIEMIASSLMYAIEYKNKTKVLDTSLIEIIKQSKIGKSSLSEEDFNILSTIDWNEFLNEK